ncbi:acid protease [Westerdykella ornata]|uniref:Acid protease n=1 Tax=Westerdykella ornata TaxID=318751 RepID=A0A6A6JSE8_WESOR|nr:acid protease [Westerdykella ornata]KAF2279520.1 acid protease [Westerdykella ornata]
MSNISVAHPSPFSFASSQLFDGTDGSWSSFIVRVGKPEQNFRILPSTTGRATWLPLPQACRPQDPDICGQSRGGYPSQEGKYGFDYNSSTTWKQIGIYNLEIGERLDIPAKGTFGFDTVGLQVQNSGGLTLSNQIVAGFVTQKFWNGQFGLDVKPSNFSDFENPQPSFMTSLKNERMIPSLSYAYTAGASYRQPKALGSLTLGGYDAARFDEKSDSSIHTFPFNSDDSRILSLGVQSITSSTSIVEDGPQGLMTAPIVSMIDSAVAQIYLPRAVCDEFQARFGLTYDNRTGFYLVNDTVHTRLQQLNPTFTFVLGNTNDPSKVVNIRLPYAAFDLQLTWPIFNETKNYFPIRRAVNDSQYTLGRTFLQESYLITDYERSNFSIYQARFENGLSAPQQKIIPILSPSSQDSTLPGATPSPSGRRSLSASAIAGITVGTVIGALLVVLLFLLYMRRRRHRVSPVEDAPYLPEKPAVTYEMHQQPTELVGDKVQYEIDSKTYHMMAAHGSEKHNMTHERGIHELPASDISGRVEKTGRESERCSEGNWI